MSDIKLINGDCLEKLKELKDNFIDAVVTDPPYGLSFMGKKWDYDVPSIEIWNECFRVLKPGGYLLAFAGTRTQHRMAVRIEDAGFEIRDMIAWIYGSGFPKSLNIGKAVDKLQGNKREFVGTQKGAGSTGNNESGNQTFVAKNQHEDGTHDITKGSSPYEGWGTALKPALEPITVARKPLSEKTVAENCLKWGVGGINIDGCRVGYRDEKIDFTKVQDGNIYGGNGIYGKAEQKEVTQSFKENARFPANLIHDGSDEVIGLFPNNNQRFFYCAKASKSERNKGCEELEEKNMIMTNAPIENEDIKNSLNKNNHPTVKPIALMEYLVKLVSREGALILDPFAGSGTTGIACKNLNRKFIGIEKELNYFNICKARINKCSSPSS